jgi:hypothetical protein
MGGLPAAGHGGPGPVILCLVWLGRNAGWALVPPGRRWEAFPHVDTDTIYTLHVPMYFLPACRGDERRRPMAFLYNLGMLRPSG